MTTFPRMKTGWEQNKMAISTNARIRDDVPRMKTGWKPRGGRDKEDILRSRSDDVPRMKAGWKPTHGKLYHS